MKGGLTMYLTFSEYQEYGGTLDETAFNNFEFEAEAIIDWYTFNRLQNDTNYPDKLKQCMYKLINMAQERAAAMALGEAVNSESTEGTGVTIASRSNDGVSISYNVISASELFDKLKNEMGNTVRLYLNGVVNELGRKVLYRGLYPGE